MTHRPASTWTLVLLAIWAPCQLACEARSDDVVVARHGVVVSVSPLSSEVGLATLQKGGNAVDAAAATAFALAVTWPEAGNLGGGGFMLVYPGGKGTPVVIDYRETAPGAATPAMYGKNENWHTHRAVGVPGTVRGLALAHKRFGKLPWKTLVEPAVALAGKGFSIDTALAGSLNGAIRRGRDFPELRRVYGKPDGQIWKAGDRLVQKDLAGTLRLIADQGDIAFYHGPIADKIVAEMNAGQGLITRQDLAGYEAKARQPIHGTYRSYDVYGPPPPSSGGICLVEMLNMLEKYDLPTMGRWSPQTLHLLAETMKRVFCDRARYLADSDFVAIPERLTSKDYARTLERDINLFYATPSERLAEDIPLARESDKTTHFSVIDGEGMAVSNTYTLEDSYGSRVVVRGAGFLLNNEMDDFNTQPGVTNRKGLIGTLPNQIAPGKRMLSSMTPTILARNGKVVLVTGSPGSRTIINTVLCVVINVVDFGMDIRAAVDAPRLHHAWFPDVIHFEGGKAYAGVVAQLKQMGHRVLQVKQGDAHSIWVDPRTGMFHGAADRRLDGKAVGY